MADDPPALEQHHCDAGANFVRIDRPNKHAQATSSHHHGAVADQSGDLCGDVCAGGRRTVAGRPLSKGNDLKMTKLKEEFFKILPPTIFFFVALHIVMFIRVLMLEGTGLAPSSSISIAVAALILGKAVLLADMVPVINRFPNKPLIYNVAWKTLIYWLMATAHSLCGTSYRFLAANWRLCCGQSKSCWRKSFGRISGRSRSFCSYSLPCIA